MRSYHAWSGRSDAENAPIPMRQSQASGSATAPSEPTPQRRTSDLTEPDETPDVFEDAQERWVFEASRASSPLPAAQAASVNPPEATYLYMEGRRSRRTSSVDMSPPPVPPKVTLQPITAVPLQATVEEAVALNVSPGRPPTRQPLSGAPPPSAAATETLYQKKCEQCEEHRKDVWYCNICETSFCDQCWSGQFVHRKPPRGGLPHEKTDVNVAEKVQNVLSPPTDNWVREQLYKADEITSWFGRIDYNIVGDYGLLFLVQALNDQRAMPRQYSKTMDVSPT